ncbi:DUF4188 domain-containing protein [Brachybacterium sp. DNPG3]
MTLPLLRRRPAERPPNVTHADLGDGIVVFHIGMTIRERHRPDLWLPVLTAMPAMLRELQINRSAVDRGELGPDDDLGFLHARTLIGAGGPWVVQYWRDVEHLYAYSRLGTRAHLPAWKRFNEAARAHPGAVGIWHETYVVPADGVETLYGNGARVGLADAVGTVSLSRRGTAARERLGS